MEITNNEIRQFLNNKIGTKQDRIEGIPAKMGNPAGQLAVSGLTNFVWVTVGDSYFPVINRKVPPKLGLPVWIGKPAQETKSNVYQVLDIRTESYIVEDGDQTSTGIAPASYYEWMALNGGYDPLFVHNRAFTFLRIGVSAAGGLNVDLYRGFVYGTAGVVEIERQDIDITAHVPASENMAAYVLISINRDGDVIQTKGAEVAVDVLDLTHIPAVPSDSAWVSGAVRVYYGQTIIREARTNTDIVDLRFGVFPASTSKYRQYIYATPGYTDLMIHEWVIDGVLEQTTKAAGAWVAPDDGKIESVMIYLDDPGLNCLSYDTIIDINKNGITIFTDQNGRPYISWFDYDFWDESTPDITTFIKGDRFQPDIDDLAFDSANLTIVLKYRLEKGFSFITSGGKPVTAAYNLET